MSDPSATPEPRFRGRRYAWPGLAWTIAHPDRWMGLWLRLVGHLRRRLPILRPTPRVSVRVLVGWSQAMRLIGPGRLRAARQPGEARLRLRPDWRTRLVIPPDLPASWDR